MSKERKKKKVVTTNEPKAAPKKTVTTANKKRKTVAPTSSRRSSASSVKAMPKEDLIFKRENYLMMLAGVGLITLGLFLMSGGAMPSNDVWDPSIIYSTRRTVLAPICILAGLVVEIFAIFRKF